MNMRTVTNPDKAQSGTGIKTTSDNGGLAVEVVDALYPQWSVNGHRIPAAFATVADRHTDPAVRHTAATTPLLPALTATLETDFWLRLRDERAAERA